MEPEEIVCHCWGVSLRKLVNFAKREQPSRASQMAECLGAGTGCGWCIPRLKEIAENPESCSLPEMDAEQYAQQRDEYIRTKQQRHQF